MARPKRKPRVNRGVIEGAMATPPLPQVPPNHRAEAVKCLERQTNALRENLQRSLSEIRNQLREIEEQLWRF